MRETGLDIFDLGLDLVPPSLSAFEPESPSSFTPFFDNPPPEVLPALRQPLTPWPPSLPRELAMGGDTPENILERCGCCEDDYVKWAQMPTFRKALSDAAKEVREHGASWRILCQGIAQDFLPILDQKLHDEMVPLALKLDALKQIVKWAGLEPREEKADAGKGTMVNIQINL